MRELENYINDWKKIKGSTPAYNYDSLKLKNKTIMKNVEKFEQTEMRERVLGITLGSLGLIGALVGTVVIPYTKDLIEFNPQLVIGITLTIASIILGYRMLLKAKVKANTSMPSKDLLIETIAKLKTKKSKLFVGGLSFIVLFIAGMALIMFGLNADDLTSQMIIVTGVALVSLFIWFKRYSNTEVKKIEPMVTELENMLKTL